MEKNLLFSRTESAGLRSLLEVHLTNLFSNNQVNKYIVFDGCATAMQIMQGRPDKATVLPQIKLAYQIWLGMLAADRHAVLGKFYALYTPLCITETDNRKTLTFCALFVNEFAAILAQAMEWPD